VVFPYVSSKIKNKSKPWKKFKAYENQKKTKRKPKETLSKTRGKNFFKNKSR
jgi:hypothetical protein